MKKVLKHLRKNWIMYGFETLAVLVGVLAAFWLEQQAENWTNDKKEEHYLSLLQADLQEDSANLISLIGFYERINASRSVLIKNLHEGRDLPLDSLTTLVNGTMGYRPFQASTETFKSIESSGDLYLIKNDSIKIQYLKLITMYQAGYRYAVESFHPVMYDYGLERWPEFMDLVSNKVDDKGKLYDKEEIDYFELARSITTIHLRRFNENLNKCVEVLELINREIEQKR